MGSDHCPVYADFLDKIVDAYEKQDTFAVHVSPLLSSQYPEFSSKQKKLSNYFMKSAAGPPAFTIMPSKRSSTSDDVQTSGTKKSKQKTIQSFFAGEEDEIDIEKLISQVQQKETSAKQWSSLFSAREIPRCKVHNEACLERTVTKKGPNLGRVFYICSKPIGPTDGPAHQFNCNFFQWKTTAK